MPVPFALTPRKLDAFRQAVDLLGQDEERGVTIPFFSPDEVSRLIKQASRLPMRTAKTRVGAQGREVTQDFDICFPAPRENALDDLASLLESAVHESGVLSAMEGFTLNDVAVQHYHKGSTGIGVHRDALRYQGLVFIITLAGHSRFCLCDDRDGNGARMIDDSPGRLTILSAPGFKNREGEDARPLHFVDQVEGGRLSIGMRFDTKAA